MPEYDYVIPFTQEDWEVPSPDFLTEEQEILYKQAYKFYGIYDYETNYIDYGFSPEEVPWERALYITDNNIYFFETYGYFRQWDTFCSVYHTLFTNDKSEKDVMEPNQFGFPHFMERDGVTWYQDYVLGGKHGYSREKWPETFELLESTPDKIAFRVTCYHRMPIDDELAKDEKAVVASYESYDVVMEQEDGQWKFSQFDVPY